MTVPVLGCVSAISLAAAFILILLAPWAERVGGPIGGSAAVGGGLLLLLLASVAGLSGFGWLAWWAAILATSSLVWAALAYFAHRFLRGGARTSKARADAVAAGANCAPRLTFGTKQNEGPDFETWRTYLLTLFSTSPTAGQLTESAMAWGGAYYGLYYTSNMAELTPRISIICERGSDGKCLADASDQGVTVVNKAPVSLAIVNSVTSSDNRVRISVGMSAALNASGGPSLAAAPAGIGPTISFPDSSLGASVGMGTYRWACERAEETEVSSSEAGAVRIEETERGELSGAGAG